MFILGGFVGMTELLSRYTDEPWKASLSLPGFIYMGTNGLISVGAYWVILEYPVFPALSQPGFLSAVAAGLGAMVVFRSRIFVYRSENGNEYPIGPDIVLNVLRRDEK